MQTFSNNSITHDDVLICGYLHKKRSFYRTLTRWIVIQGHYLYSYKTKAAAVPSENTTKIIDLKSYTDIIFSNDEQYFELVSLDGQTNKRYYIPNDTSKKTILNTKNTLYSWLDIINPLLISPTTPTQEVFHRIYASLGWNVDDSLINFTKTLNKYINDLWCYRAVDLLAVKSSLWNQLHVPIDIQTKLRKYIQVWETQKSFTQFQETIPKTKNILHILDELVADNKSQSTLNHIKYLKDYCTELCAVNIDKIKLYNVAIYSDNIPALLSDILSKKIYNNQTEEKYEFESNEYSNVDPTLTFDGIAKLLSNSLFVDEKRIEKYLTPFVPYKYDRLYHLSKMHFDLYQKLMYNAPRCIQLQLYDMINACRIQIKDKSYSIPKLQVNLFKSDASSVIIDIKNICEEKINGNAQFIGLNVTTETIQFDEDNKYIVCRNLIANKKYNITMQYINGSDRLCCSKITSFVTLPNAPILYADNVNVTDSTVTVKLADVNMEWRIEIAEASTEGVTIWKKYIKNNGLDFQLISDLKCDSNYQIRARFRNESGLSLYTGVLNIKTELPKPPTFSFENITKNSVTIKFNRSIHSSLNCYIKITEFNSNNIKVVSVRNVKEFCFDNLKQATTYEIKAYYPKYKIFTDNITFETMDWSDCLTKKEGEELKRLINNYTNNKFKQQWKLLYKGSKHGFNAKSFYNQCDMKQNTICIIRTDEKEVFAGFTSLLWDKSKCNSNAKSVKDENGFIFSIKSKKLSKPILFPVGQSVGYSNGYIFLFHNERYKIYLKDNCNANNLSTKTMFDCCCYNQPFKVKEMEVYQLFERIRTHNKGNKNEWKNKPINEWTTDDILHYMTTVDMTDYWYYKIISVIKDCSVNGCDFMELQSPKEIGDAFRISENEKLCEDIYARIMSFGVVTSSCDSVFDDNKSDEDFDKFEINIFHQQKYIVLNEMVTKETDVLFIKKLYKLQTGVKAPIKDIHFYCRLKEMRNNEKLEDINIIDERHIISVKFGVNAGENK